MRDRHLDHDFLGKYIPLLLGVNKKAKKAMNKPSLARQAAMEKERERVVEAYRALKAQRYAS